jgi:hypothetical protein
MDGSHFRVGVDGQDAKRSLVVSPSLTFRVEVQRGTVMPAKKARGRSSASANQTAIMRARSCDCRTSSRPFSRQTRDHDASSIGSVCAPTGKWKLPACYLIAMYGLSRRAARPDRNLQWRDRLGSSVYPDASQQPARRHVVDVAARVGRIHLSASQLGSAGPLKPR